MRRTGSLYDAYQLSNSTAIPMFQGSAGEESVKVGSYMQGLYDQNLAGALALNTNLDNMSGHSADDKIVNETREYYKDALTKAAQNGDFENLMPQIQQLGGQYANDAKVISSILTQKQEWLKQLDDKDKNLTSAQKAQLAKIADTEYALGNSKLRRNVSGQLMGTYSGTRVDKNIDTAKKVDEWMSKAAEHSGGNISMDTDGTWMYKTAKGWQTMTSAQIQAIIEPAAANDTEYQGYRDMMGRINAHNALKYNSPEELSEGPYKAAALKIMKDEGLSFKDSLYKALYRDTSTKVHKNALEYATAKYKKNNITFERTMSGNPFKEIEAAKEVDNGGIIIEGNEVITTEDERDPQKLTSSLGTTQNKILQTSTTIKRLEEQWRNANPEEKVALETNIKALKGTLDGLKLQETRANTILQSGRDAAAIKLDYTSYNAMIKDKASSVAADVRKFYPNGITSALTGKKVSPEEIAEAMLEGRVTTKRGAAAGGVGMAAQYGERPVVGAQLKLKDGSEIFIPQAKGGDRINTVVDRLQSRGDMNRFNNTWKETQKEQTTLSVADPLVTFGEREKKTFQGALDLAFSTGAVTLSGTNKVIDEEDKAKMAKIEPLGMSGIKGPNGEDRMKFVAFDKEGNRIGGYTVSFTGNATQTKVRTMARQTNVESRRWADVADRGSFANAIVRAPIGEKLEVGDVEFEDKTVGRASILKTFNNETKKTEYHLINDEKQTIVSTTVDAATYNDWVNGITGKPNFTQKTKSTKN